MLQWTHNTAVVWDTRTMIGGEQSPLVQWFPKRGLHHCYKSMTWNQYEAQHSVFERLCENVRQEPGQTLCKFIRITRSGVVEQQNSPQDEKNVDFQRNLRKRLIFLSLSIQIKVWHVRALIACTQCLSARLMTKALLFLKRLQIIVLSPVYHLLYAKRKYDSKPLISRVYMCVRAANGGVLLSLSSVCKVV